MENMLLAIVSFFCFAFVIHTYNHLPYKDFRPYAVGKDLVEGMKTCDELGLPCEEVAYFYQVKDKTTGEELEITSKAYQENWENYDFIASSDKTIILQEGYEAPIHDFSIELDGADYTYSILDEPKAFLLITYNINKADVDIQPEVNAFAAQCDAAGIPFVAISASIDADLQTFKEQTNTAYPFYYMDETTLKTIIRSNPGLLLLEKGVVKAKWHHNDFPAWEEVQ